VAVRVEQGAKANFGKKFPGPRVEGNPISNPDFSPPRERPARAERRQSRWNSAVLLTGAAVVFFWWIGSSLLNLADREGHPVPAVDMPHSSQTALNNNAIARRKLATNLEGTAVVYPEEVKGLAAPNERYRTDLSVRQLADTLKIDAQAIARKGSLTEIDPESVLFTAVACRLSECAKARSRSERQLQARDGLLADYTADEWVTQELTFTLNTLKHPDDDQKAILRAIWRSVREIMPEPGEKIRAVGLNRRILQLPFVDLKPGYLPLENPPASD
jgi:hypothetical protein